MNPPGSRRLLTFRLDTERRQRLRARLAREGRTMSEVVTSGLRQYVQHARHRDERGTGTSRGSGTLRGDGPSRGTGTLRGDRPSRGDGPGIAGALVLPERIAGRLRELRASGRSELLSVTLAALHDAGWPLRPLAEALGISKQAVQARVRRRTPSGEPTVCEPVVCEPPPPFPQRRMASAAGLRPHLTIKIDHALRASAHQVAADEGHSLTEVVESILDHYLRQGPADRDADGTQARREASRAASRSR